MPLDLDLLATVLLGLYAGSLLTEGVVLVPYWRRMAHADFMRLHGDVGPHLFRYFAPLTTLAVGLSVAAAMREAVLYSWRTLAAVLCVAALLTFFIYFKRANAAFAAGNLTESELAPELARWSAWHWLRTVAVVAAFVAAIGASA
ncbi:MAG: hypothetical protein RIF41_15665 [Polyangiaceae bacterium]